MVVNPNSLVMSTIKRSCLSYKPTYPLVISGNHHLELVSPLAMGHGFANCWPEKTVPSASATIQYHIVGYFISPLNILYIYKCIHYICIYIIYICIYYIYICIYIYIIYVYYIYIYICIYYIIYIGIYVKYPIAHSHDDCFMSLYHSPITYSQSWNIPS